MKPCLCWSCLIADKEINFDGTLSSVPYRRVFLNTGCALADRLTDMDCKTWLDACKNQTDSNWCLRVGKTINQRNFFYLLLYVLKNQRWKNLLSCFFFLFKPAGLKKVSKYDTICVRGVGFFFHLFNSATPRRVFFFQTWANSLLGPRFLSDQSRVWKMLHSGVSKNKKYHWSDHQEA